MLLKNTKARLITINGRFENGQRIEKFKILPGDNPAVDVPDELCETAFVQALIDDGVLLVVGESPEGTDESAGSQYKTLSRSELQDLCTHHEIEFKSNANRGDLIALLVEFDKKNV